LPNAIIFKAIPVLFAVDTSILITSQNVYKFQNDLNTAFGQITKWFQINSLSLNLSKTYFIQFSSKSLNYFDINITYENNQILKVNDIKLMIFERKIMRKIFGPTRTDDGYWRIKNNQEISDILKGRNIIGFIKKQKLNWLGHVECMAEDNNVQKIKRWKPMSKRPIGRPKTCWENDILEDIRHMNIQNWKKMAQNIDSWKKAVEQARTLHRL
jgi:hypothetical protein